MQIHCAGETYGRFGREIWIGIALQWPYARIHFPPDFSIEMLNDGEIAPGVEAHHWVVRGTNTGPGIDNSAPTGRKFTFKGASIVHVEGDKTRSDYAYFDRKAKRNRRQPVYVLFGV
jgi:hypothetical protein